MDKAPDAFRTITEVATELNLPQHVLRFWETRFPQIKPMKRGGGRRYYRPEDVDLLRGIRHLLYGEGYTIRGVQRILKDEGIKFVQAAWKTTAANETAEGAEIRESDEADLPQTRSLLGLWPTLLQGSQPPASDEGAWEEGEDDSDDPDYEATEADAALEERDGEDDEDIGDEEDDEEDENDEDEDDEEDDDEEDEDDDADDEDDEADEEAAAENTELALEEQQGDPADAADEEQGAPASPDGRCAPVRPDQPLGAHELSALSTDAVGVLERVLAELTECRRLLDEAMPSQG